LKDVDVAQKIVSALNLGNCNNVLEIGPGTGVLTQFVFPNKDINFKAIEIDTESVHFLRNKFKGIQLIEGDFLELDLNTIFDGEPFIVLGNFPYNISSQIFFHVLDHKQVVPQVVGMLQKEVAERFCSGPGNKEYGIISVLLQAYFDCKYLFTVDEHVFDPPPKVKSGVIRIERNNKEKLNCDEKLFKQIVKQSFSMRRKTLRNCLKSLNLPVEYVSSAFFDKRAEVLSVEDFIRLTKEVESNFKKQL
jgi:16S rRNA (adenine1518-N6/adenine1519-N6)-dimethyltransferase